MYANFIRGGTLLVDMRYTGLRFVHHAAELEWNMRTYSWVRVLLQSEKGLSRLTSIHIYLYDVVYTDVRIERRYY